MATIQSSIQLNDRFSSTLNKLDSGLSQSTRTFDRFKSALSGGGMPKFGDKINAGLSAVDAKVNQTGSTFKSMLGANLIGSGITAGLSAIKNGVSSMIGDLSEASATWQTFEGNMSNLGKSSGQINTIKKDLQSFAQETIYSASDMSSTYSQLAAVGIGNTTKLVKGFGGLAAASSEPQQAMKTLSQQATQMAAKPMVQWADFKLMLEQSPAGMAAVAKTMGMSTKDMVKSIQDGKVATTDFFDAVAKTGTNANFTKMATQYKTVGQAIDGLREGLTNKLQPAFDKVSQIGIKAVNGLSDSVNNIDFSGMADKAISVFSKVGQTVSAFWQGFSNTPAIAMLGAAMQGIGMSIAYVVKSMLGIKDGAKGFDSVKSAGETVGKVIANASQKIMEFAGWIRQIDPSTIQNVAKGAIALVAGLKGFSAINGIFAGFSGKMLFGLAAGMAAFLGSLKPGTVKKLGEALAIALVAFKTWRTVAKGAAKAQAAFKVALSIGGAVGKFISGLAKMIAGNTGVTATAPAAAAAEGSMGAAASTAAPSLLQVGGAALMIGGAILLAAAGMYVLVQAALALAAGGWPAVGALAALVVVIGAFMAVTILLGPALAAGAAGLILFGVGLALIGVAVLLAAAGLALIAVTLPIVAQYGLQAAVGFLALAGALLLFGVGALVAGVGAVVLGAGLLVVGVGALLAAVGITLLAAATILLGVGLIIAGAGLLIISLSLPVVAQYGLMAAVGFLAMGVALLILGPAAMIAGVGAAILAVGLLLVGAAVIVAAVGVMLLAVGMILLGAGIMIAAAGIMILAIYLPIVAMVVMTAAAGFLMLGMALMVFGPMALIAGAAVTVLAAGLLLFGVAAIVAGAGAAVLGAGLMVVAAGMLMVAAAVAVTAAALGALGAAVMTLAMAFVTAGTMLVSAIISAMSRVVSAVTSGISSAVSAAKGFAGDLVSVGKDLIQGLVNGIKGMVKSAVSAVTNVAKSVVSAAKSILHIGSPSRLFNKFGRWTIEGYTNGIGDRESGAVNRMSNLMTDVVDAGNNATIAPIDISNIIIGDPVSTFKLPDILGVNPGDLLADSFARAAGMVDKIANALTSLPTKRTVAVDQVGGGTPDFPGGNSLGDGPTSADLNSGDTPTTTVAGLTGGGTTNHTTNNSSSHQTIVAAGAIQVTAATADDGEAIAQKLEDYLKERDNAGLKH